MRFFLELMSLLALAVGFVGAVSAVVFCWREAMTRTDPQTGSFAIAGAILTGLLAIALAIYLKPGPRGDDGAA